MKRNLALLACFRWFLSLTVLAAAGTVQAQLYYRVDAGYSKSLNADVKDQDPASAQICGDTTCNPGTLEKAVGSSSIVSAGVGRRFNPNIRADVTLGYRDGYKLDDSEKSTDTIHFKADVNSLALMVNVYRDLPLSASTPYVGAGLGVAQNKIGTISLEDVAGFTGTAPGGTKIGLAFAFMAGVGIPLGGLTLDVGYRFIDLGKFESGTGDVIMNSIVGVTTTPYAGASGRFRAHELTVGLRF